ncbi:MAG: DUF309 domain-containing protein [Rhizobiaceae bacterium]
MRASKSAEDSAVSLPSEKTGLRITQAMLKSPAWQSASSIALPESAYLPGRTLRPEDREGARIEHLDIAWAHGLRLLLCGYYWEAHEALEPVWMGFAPNSRERHLVQAVIQIANLSLKARMGRSGAAGRIIPIVVQSLDEAFARGSETLMGLQWHRSDMNYNAYIANLLPTSP